MAFIEKQRHGKHAYYYLVKSVRLSPAKVRKVRVFLGRSVPPHESLQAFFSELERKTPRPYAPAWLSMEVVERLEDLRAAARRFQEQAPQTRAEAEDFLVRFTYNSNAIEGNPLTLRQTALILAEGIVPQGAKAEHVVEVLNGKDAWSFVKNHRGALNASFLKRVQYEVTKNTSCRLQGEYRDAEVRISGSDWMPPAASKIPGLIATLLGEWKKQRKTLHPVEAAGWLHNQLVQIHPFTDGNGRTARLVLNRVLERAGFPPVIIEARNKEAYYRAIEKADAADSKPFADFLARELLDQYTTQKTTEAKP